SPLSFSSFRFLSCPAPHFPLFPYTTLFRSLVSAAFIVGTCPPGLLRVFPRNPPSWHMGFRVLQASRHSGISGTGRIRWPRHQTRSEEHTSELQSRENLVCRLLLEKKKRKCL